MEEIYIINGEIFFDDQVTKKTETVYYKRNGESFSENEVDCFNSIPEAIKYYEKKRKHYSEKLEKELKENDIVFYNIMVEKMTKVIRKLNGDEK